MTTVVFNDLFVLLFDLVFNGKLPVLLTKLLTLSRSPVLKIRSLPLESPRWHFPSPEFRIQFIFFLVALSRDSLLNLRVELL